VGFLHFKRGVSTLLSRETQTGRGFQALYNSYNSYNYIKREKIQIKGKIKGYGTRFARVVSKARAKAWIMHSLCSCFLKIKSINTSLVDTR
jgi:hypothetical protein